MRIALVLTLVLAACTAQPEPVSTLAATSLVRGFPPVQHARGIARSNTVLAADFLDLVFELESGQPIPQLLRREAPVRVLLRSPALRNSAPDLEALLARLRSEAGIDIASTNDEAEANLFVEAVPASGLQSAVPGAACFLAPGVRDWAEYTSLGRANRPRWSQQSALYLSAVFIPAGIAPQEIRDCLHEEIAQSLGPVNDLYRLPDSVFNDDNLHSVLTAFDMVILRALYSPALQTGMRRPQVASLIPGILAQVNPAGSGIAPLLRGATPDSWKASIEATLSRDKSRRSRIAAGTRAVDIARNIFPADHRLALSDLALGRLILQDDPANAATLFINAYDISLATGDPVRAAHAGLHVAVVALSTGRFDSALTIADRHLPDARRAENATLVSGFQAIRAEALQRLGRAAEAETARQHSLRWAGYAFGASPQAIDAAQGQIAKLANIGGNAP